MVLRAKERRRRGDRLLQCFKTAHEKCELVSFKGLCSFGSCWSPCKCHLSTGVGRDWCPVEADEGDAGSAEDEEGHLSC